MEKIGHSCLVGFFLACQASLAGAPVTLVTLAAIRPQSASRLMPPAAIVDVVVLDARGLAVADLAPGDFAVSVDGKPRPVVSAQYVFRGPGAATAAEQLATGWDDIRPGAEVPRSILLAVDEGSLVGGDERAVRTLASRLIDRLGPADLVAIVSLPRRGAELALTTEREMALEMLRQVAGRAEPVAAAVESPPPLVPVSDAVVETGKGRDRAAQVAREVGERRAAAEAALNAPGPESQSGPSGLLFDLRQLLDAVRGRPGPKALVLISAGLPGDESSPALEQVAAAAAASRTTVHVIYRHVAGWRRLSGGAAVAGGAAARSLDARAATVRGAGGEESSPGSLAVLTGGVLVEAGKNVDQVVERLARGLSGAYAVNIGTIEADWDGNARDLRVSVRRSGVSVVRARRRWMPRDEPVPAAADATRPIAATETARAPARSESAASASRPAPAAQNRMRGVADPEVRVVLASAAEYLAAYERDVTAVVAEEHYQQVASYRRSATAVGREVRVDLRSDFLMVQPPGGGYWIPFRDVFAVNGVEVRDREERLRQLFLTASAEAISEAQRITDESARYNIGGIIRNVNVPTFPLVFLKVANRGRFAFERRGEEVVGGLRTWRLDYAERSSPTFIVTEVGGKDVPVSGSFWIDPMNGRVVKTRLRTLKGNVAMDVTVIYRPSETLGLWLPVEMKDKYAAADVIIEGTANYSNFRRFRVFTDEQIKIPKLD